MMSATSIRSIPSIDSEPVDVSMPFSLARAVMARRPEFVRPHRIRVKIGTWNVAACPGTDKDLASWFVDVQGVDRVPVASDPPKANSFDTAELREEKINLLGGNKIGLYVLGLQEVVDLNQTKEYMTRTLYTDNSATQRWQAALESAMPLGYQLVVSEQMFGILLLIYASPEVAPTISNVSTKQVGTGLGGWFANKGAIATRIVLGETTRMVFVNCHLASGATPANLDRRCADAANIVSKTQFDAVVNSGVEEDDGQQIGDEDFCFWFGDLNFRLDGLPGDDIRRLLHLHARGEYGAEDPKSSLDGEGVLVTLSPESSDISEPSSSFKPSDKTLESLEEDEMRDPDDFPEDPSMDPTSLQATLDSLLPHEQLGRMMKDSKAFHDGWKEGPIVFLPTYKYDVGTVGLFDSSEKQRAPSWCDRILYRTRKDKEAHDTSVREETEAKEKDEEMKSRGLEEDDDVLFTYDPDTDGETPPTRSSAMEYDEYDENEDAAPDNGESTGVTLESVNLELYTSHQRITSSDHKPVTSVFTINYQAVVPALKGIVHSEVAREFDRAENEGRPGITVIAEGSKGQDQSAIEFGDMHLLERKSCYLTIANTGSVSATFTFVQKPQAEENQDSIPASGWLSTFFARSDADHEDDSLGISVTLEPGETILAVVAAQISSIRHIQLLNSRTATLSDVLILRVDGGRDHFIPVSAMWLPSSFGRSIDELTRIEEGGIRKFVNSLKIEGSIGKDRVPRCSASRELFRITTAMEGLAERCIADEAMLDNVVLPTDPGWPLDCSTWTTPPEIREGLSAALTVAIDTDASLLAAMPIEMPLTYKLEAVSNILILFLSSLTDGVIPAPLWQTLTTSLPMLSPSTPDVKSRILDILCTSPQHNITFVFLTTALSRIAAELSPASALPPPTPTRRLGFGSSKPVTVEDMRRTREKRFSEILAPVLCRGGVKDRAREAMVVELCVRPDDG